MTMRINKKSNKKPLIIVILIILFGIGAYLAFAYVNNFLPFAPSSESSKSNDQEVNLERTDSEKAASENLKNNPESKLENNQSDAPDAPKQTTSEGKKIVNVLLTNSGISNGTVSASGFVTDLAESGGICTYVFTNGGISISKTSKTLVNPTSTTCETVKFSASELTADGTWKVVINYDSENATGKSNTKEFTK